MYIYIYIYIYIYCIKHSSWTGKTIRDTLRLVSLSVHLNGDQTTTGLFGYPSVQTFVKVQWLSTCFQKYVLDTTCILDTTCFFSKTGSAKNEITLNNTSFASMDPMLPDQQMVWFVDPSPSIDLMRYPVFNQTVAKKKQFGIRISSRFHAKSSDKDEKTV